MNQLGITFLGVAVLATLLTTAAAVCYLVSARRGFGRAARVAAGFLAALVALPLFAVCPLPYWPTWATQKAPPQALDAGPEEFANTAPRSDGGAGETAEAGGLDLAETFAAVRRTFRGFRSTHVRPQGGDWNWPAILALVLLIGAGVGSLRLLFGLLALHLWCRRGRRIEDSALLDLLTGLRNEMGGPTAVELREVPDLTAPATIGWLRPVILLPPDWRGWDDTERRAVLAHEWAHVCRRDYLAALVARVGVALHFYHPLVYWLAGRLHLQQELEADAVGVRWAGGRDPYLRALARLALRQEGRPLAWPAKAFLSGTGTLMRRIHMLRSHVAFPDAPAPRRGRAWTLALLAVTALGVAALRGPAQAEDEPEARAPAQGKVAADLPPFDLTYLPADAVGALCLRPAAIFGRPEFRPALDTINLGFSLMSLSEGLQVPDGLDLRLEAIEQVVCWPRIETDKNQKKGPQSQLLFGLTMIRTVEKFDWKAQLSKIVPQLEEITYGGKSYYKLPRSPAFIRIDNPRAAFYLYIPDDRTLVMDNESNIRRFIDGKAATPKRAWAADWKRVERCVVAMSFDLQDKQWFADRRQPEDGLSEGELLVLKNTTSAAFGVRVADKITIESVMRCPGAPAGEKVAREVATWSTKGRAELDEEMKKRKPAGYELVWMNFSRDLLKNARVECEGDLIRWHTEARLDFAAMSRYLLDATGFLREAEGKLKKQHADK